MESEAASCRIEYDKSLGARMGLEPDAFREWIARDATQVIEASGLVIVGAVRVIESETAAEGLPCFIASADVDGEIKLEL